MESTDLPVYSVRGHKEIINCIDGVGGLGIGEGAPEIATGSRDGSYFVITIYISLIFSISIIPYNFGYSCRLDLILLIIKCHIFYNEVNVI